jgi:hypothetical protein
VTNTNNAGAGSLRAAIVAANGLAGTQGIAFQIPGVAPFTIAPTTPLPPLTDAVVIDATTQPGYAGTPIVALAGSAMPVESIGFLLSAAGSTVRGLSIHSFSTANLAGGNLVVLDGANSTVAGNYIGLDPSGAAPLPSHNGVVADSSGSVVGGSSGFTIRNVIGGMSGAGVLMSAGVRTAIDRNVIDDNGGLGIDAGAAGVTPNDVGDVDGVQNAPAITSFTLAAGMTSVGIGLSSTPNTEFRVQVFMVSSCDPSGYGEGALFLGQATLTTGIDGNGNTSINALPLAPGAIVTATAINALGGTSEFSRCAKVVASPPKVLVGPVGGNGGTPFGPINCPAGSVVTAFKGNASNDVEALQVWCSPLTDNMLGPEAFAGATTTNGDASFGAALTCGPNAIVSGIFGQSGPALGAGTTNVIDMLGVHCTDLTTQESEALGPVGLQGIRQTGTGTFLRSCPAGTRLTGIQGRKGAVLDSIALICQ